MRSRNNQADQIINQIAADNYSGAAQILRRARDVFPLLTSRHSANGPASVEAARQAVIEVCIDLVRAQPHMSSLMRVASVVISAARTTEGVRDVFKAVEDASISFIENSERAAQAAAARAGSLLRSESTVLTHSRSSTVMAAFIEAKRAGKDFSVVATESRPMLEGRSLAEALNDQDIRVTLIADSAASLAMDEVDIVLIGADTITPKNLVNKIGTRMIALAARVRDLPIYSVCDTSKFIPGDYRSASAPDQKSARELWPGAPAGVLVLNRYFEPTPLAYFSGIITEDGTLSSEEAASLAASASVDDMLVNALDGWTGLLR